MYIRRITSMIIAFLITVCPLSAVYATYQDDDYALPVQALTHSKSYLALSSILAAGGILPSIDLTEWQMRLWMNQLESYPEHFMDGRRYIEVPLSTVNDIFDTTITTLETEFSDWQREANFLRPLPPINQSNVEELGVIDGVPVFRHTGFIERYSSNTISIRGVDSFQIGNIHYSLNSQTFRLELNGEPLGNRIYNEFSNTRHIHSGLVLMHVTSNNTFQVGYFNVYWDYNWNSYYHQVGAISPSVTIPNSTMLPLPRPIELNPVNIIDSTPNYIMRIIQDITNPNDSVLIWLPDYLEYLRDRPINEIVRPPGTRPGTGDCDDDSAVLILEAIDRVERNIQFNLMAILNKIDSNANPNLLSEILDLIKMIRQDTNFISNNLNVIGEPPYEILELLTAIGLIRQDMDLMRLSLISVITEHGKSMEGKLNELLEALNITSGEELIRLTEAIERLISDIDFIRNNLHIIGGDKTPEEIFELLIAIGFIRQDMELMRTSLITAITEHGQSMEGKLNEILEVISESLTEMLDFLEMYFESLGLYIFVILLLLLMVVIIWICIQMWTAIWHHMIQVWI